MKTKSVVGFFFAVAVFLDQTLDFDNHFTNYSVGFQNTLIFLACAWDFGFCVTFPGR